MGRINQIGLSISDASIEMIQVTKSGKNKAKIISTATGPIPAGIINRGVIKDHEKLIQVLNKVYESAKPKPFNTKDVSVSLPDNVAFTHVFKFPGALNENDVASTLKFEAEDIIPYPIDDLYVTFKIIKQNEEKTDVLFVGAPKDIIDGYVTTLEEAGYKIKQLEIEANALIRVLIPGIAKGKAVMIMDLGGTNTRFTLADEEGLNGSFSLPVGGNAITEAIAKELSISGREAEALKKKKSKGKKAKVIEKAIDEYLEKIVEKAEKVIEWYGREDEGQLDKMVLTGGGSGLPDLTEKLSQKLTARKLSMDIVMGSPWQNIETKTAPKPASVSGRIFAPALGAVPIKSSKLVPEIDLIDVLGKRRNPFKNVSNVQKTVDLMAKQDPGADKEPLSLRRLSVLINQYNTVFAIIAAAIIVGAIGFIIFWLFFADRDFQQLTTPTTTTEPTITEEVGEEQDESETEATTGQLILQMDINARTSDVVAANYQEVPSYGTTFSYQLEATETVDSVASGRVTLFNNTSADQPLITTTRLLSEDGVLFRLTNAVTVPAEGQIEAEVYADQAGASGNIASTSFTIPGLPDSLQADIYATSSEAMSGGTEEVAIFSEEVYEQALAELKRQLLSTPSNLFGAESTENTYLVDLAELEPVELETSVEIGQSTDVVELIGTVSISALSFSETNLKEVIKTVLEKPDAQVEINGISVESVADDLQTAELDVEYSTD